MKLTSQEEYGLRCMLQVARRQHVGPVAISAVAEAEGISSEYAAKLMRILRQEGLVSAKRGAHGGYSLVRSANEVTVFEVLSALDKPLYTDAFCTGHSGHQDACVHSETGCSIRVLWQWVGASLQRTLKRVTLADLLGGPMPVHQSLAQETPSQTGVTG